MRFSRRSILGGVGASLLASSCNALTSKQSLLLFSGVPFWVQQKYGPLAPFVLFAAHDDAGLYWAKGIGHLAESQCFSNSRTGTRWGKNASGVYVSAPSGQTLIIPDGTGAQLDEARTNILVNSNNFGAWINNNNIVVTTGAIESIFSGLNADMIAANGTLNQHYVGGTQGAPLPSTQYCIGIIAKRNSANYLHSLITADNGYVQWDLNTGAVVFSSAGAGTLATPAAGIDLGSGWWLFVMVYTRSASGSSRLQIYPLAASSNTAGPTESSTASVYLANADAQPGVFWVAPIITAGASATVGADVRKLIGPALAAALAAKGAYFETNGLNWSGTGNPFVFQSAVASGTGIVASANNALQIQDNNGFALGSLGAGTVAGVTKSAFGYGPAGKAAIANGGARGTNSTAWLGTVAPFVCGNRSLGDRAINGLARKLTFISTDPTLTAWLTA